MAMDSSSETALPPRSQRCGAIAFPTFSLLSVSVFLSSLLLFYFLSDRGGNNEFDGTMSASAGTSARRILCYGDSLTAGFHNRGMSFNPYAKHLQSLLGQQFKVEWIGLSGWTTSQLLDSAGDESTRDFTSHSFPGLRRKLEKDNSGSTALAIVMAGTNDLGHGRTPEDIADNLKGIYSIMSGAGVEQILAVGIPDSAFMIHSPEANGRRLRTNEALKALSESDEGRRLRLRYVDCPISKARGDPFESDGLHFAGPTYGLLAERLLPEVEDILKV